MINVRPALEPAKFDDVVRQPGLEVIRELVGEPRLKPRRGKKRKPVAATRDEIPSESFPPLWREVIPEMLSAFNRVCAYSALYIYPATGAPTVDHMAPRSKAWDRVYEWDNYRLACSLLNGIKSAHDVLDPFEVFDGMFTLEFTGYQVGLGAGLAPDLASRAKSAIKLLQLNSQELCRAREEYVVSYEDNHIDIDYLSRRAPFVAMEMDRQGLLKAGDNYIRF